jgi:hypothetical protein
MFAAIPVAHYGSEWNLPDYCDSVALKRNIGTIAVLALLVVVPAAQAHGRLDRSFGTEGRTLSPIPPPVQEEAPGQVKFGMAEGPRGEIFVFDGEVIAAYSARGVPNRSFGQGGYLYLADEIRYVPQSSGTRPGFALADVAVDSRGRIVVAGTIRFAVPGLSGEGTLATVRRYLPDGKLDPSFGSGGSVTSDLGLPLVLSWQYYPGSTTYQSPPEMEVAGLAIDSRDRPVLTGSARTVVTGCDLFPMLASQGFVARLTPAGALDSELSGRGSELPGGAWSSVLHPAVTGSAGISATVSRNECRSPHKQDLVRLDGDGGLNPSFGAGGLSSVGFQSVAALAVDHSNRILLFGERLQAKDGAEATGLSLSPSLPASCPAAPRTARSVSAAAPTSYCLRKEASPRWPSTAEIVRFWRAGPPPSEGNRGTGGSQSSGSPGPESSTAASAGTDLRRSASGGERTLRRTPSSSTAGVASSSAESSRTPTGGRAAPASAWSGTSRPR